jgi:hypothetical protein
MCNTWQTGALLSAMVCALGRGVRPGNLGTRVCRVHTPWHSAKTGLCRVPLDETHSKPNLKKINYAECSRLDTRQHLKVCRKALGKTYLLKKIKKSLSSVILLGTRQTLRYRFIICHSCFFFFAESHLTHGKTFAKCPKKKHLAKLALPAVF